MGEKQLTISLNARVAPLVDRLKGDPETLRVAVGTGARGETMIDAGVRAPGSLAAGIAVAEIALGGLGHVSVGPVRLSGAGLEVAVRSPQPVLACLGSQMAGWPLADAASGFRALGSGPARALAAREPVFGELGWAETAADAVLLLEGDAPPPPDVTDAVATACGLHPSRLTFVLVPSTSLAGAVQVAARCLETAVGKARRFGFPLADIVDGIATSPLAPPHPDPAESMGRANDAILYGGAAHLFVAGPPDAARELAAHLPSGVSASHGRPFAEILRDAGGDFYAVDPLVFGPATVAVTSLSSGATFTSGAARPDLVARALGIASDVAR